MPLFVLCNEHPDLYREVGPDGTSSPIGYREALSLGKIENRRFVEAHQYDLDGRYSVWESPQQSSTFLIVPMHYRVDRGPAGSPQLEWLQVFDTTDDIDLPCLLQVQCVPDLTPVELAVLRARIQQATGLKPTLLLPTSPAVGSTGVTLKATTIGHALQAVTDDDVVHLAIRVSFTEAVITTALIKNGGGVAQMVFETGDPHLPLITTVHLGIDELAGPYPVGAVQVVDGKIRNVADTSAHVSALWATNAHGDWIGTQLAAPLTIGPGETVALPAQYATAKLAEAKLDPPGTTTIKTRTLYLENLHTVVLVRNDVNYAALQIATVHLAFTAPGGAEIGGADLLPTTFVREVTLVRPLGSGPGRTVTVTPLVTESNGNARHVEPTDIDLSEGVILQLADLLTTGG